MAKQKSGRRPRHIPQRTCVACREVQAKGTLVRVVRTSEGVMPDAKGKLPGRGAYLHAKPECWQRMGAVLPNALRTELSEADLQRLTEYFSALPAE
jgi:predicted RNA-binding protein YlxR (DUF448 family)